MEPLNRQRVNAVFETALDLRPGDRAPFLELECGDDAALRAEVESLLEASEAATGFLEKPAQLLVLAEMGPELPPEFDTVEGTRIGPYLAISLIGRGGMGSVYRAVRADDEYKHEVAIKLLHRGMDSGAMLRRFKTERQILASLEHPNIARLLDGGATADGRPYFVMEYIEGVALNVYAEGLSVRASVELFRQICLAVQSAHQKLVVHRDLKPANILVTKDGVPKLLDFGIAKLIDPGAAEDQTATGMQLMTPAYASPEQIRGELITTASDVYSLGVMLYELLTGSKPLKLPTGDPLAVAKIVSEQEPPKPSTLNSGLAEDLDNILLKALAKEPARRYGSAADFAEDLRRYLEGLPVNARPATIWYRTGKFLRRNPGGLTAAALVLLSLAGGVVSTLRQARRTEARFNDVRALSHSVLFEIHDAIQALPGSTAARELVVSRALQFLDKLAAEPGNDLELQRELAAGYMRLADVQGSAGSNNLGKRSAAQASYEKALALRMAIAAQTPGDAEAQKDLAATYDLLGSSLQEKSNEAVGQQYLEKAYAIRLTLADRYPQELAKSYFSKAQVLVSAGNFEEGLQQHRLAQKFWDQAAKADPTLFQRTRSIVHKRIGGILVRVGRLDEAQPEYEAAVALDQARMAANPADLEAKLDISYAYSDLALIWMRRNDHPKALAYARQAQTVREQVFRADPSNERARGATASAAMRVGSILWSMGKSQDALTAYAKALPIRQESVAKNTQAIGELALLADTLTSMGLAEMKLGRRGAAKERFVQSAALLEKVTKARPQRTEYSDDLTNVKKQLAALQ